jgi:arabinofuranosyltransferase
MNFFRRNFLPLFAVAFLLTAVAFVYLGRPKTGIDDGCIFLTYAGHIAQGEGFVFNTGGEKVEGFTSLLWVLVCSLFYKVFSAPEVPLMIFLMLLATATLTVVYTELEKTVAQENKDFSERWLFFSFVLFLLCIGFSWFTWAVLTLMENGLWNFLLLTSAVLVLKMYRTGHLTLLQKTSLVGASALLLLTRPEALLWCALFALSIAIAEWQKRRKFLFTLIFAATQLVTAFLLTQFRKSYFGYPLPNTYYAKVSHNRLYNLKEGIDYLISFLTGFNFLISFLFVLLCVAALFALKPKRNDAAKAALRRTPPSFVIATIFILAGLGIPLVTGGDHFGSFRFYQGILPLFAWGLPAFFWLRNRRAAWSKKFVGNAWVVLAVCAALLFSAKTMLNLKKAGTGTQLAFEFYLAQDGRQLGDQLNRIFTEQKPSVGMIVVGGFSLHYRGETVDLMGLNNTAMGHSKGERIGIKNHAAFNKEVFYQLNPELLLPRPVVDSAEARSLYLGSLQATNFDNKALKNIFADAEFQQRFQPAYLERNGVRIFCFVNQSRLAYLQSLSGTRLTVLQ